MYKSENHILNFVMVIASVWIVNKFWQCFYEKKKTSFLYNDNLQDMIGEFLKMEFSHF